VHAGLLLALTLHGPPAVESARAPEEAIVIDFLERPPVVDPAPPAPPTPGPPPPATRGSESARRRPTPAAPAPPAPSAPPPADEATGAIPGDPAGPLRMRQPELLLDQGAVDRLTRDGVIAGPRLEPGVATGRKRGPSFGDKLAAMLRQDEARGNVERGKVHPQVYDYLRGAQRLFQPDLNTVYRNPSAPNTVGRTVDQWARGAAGTRYLRDPGRGLPADQFAGYNAATRATADAAAMTCLICLVIRPGESPRVELAASSGSREVDRAATEALGRTAGRRPGDGDLRPQRSCYRFSVSLTRAMPAPVVGCGFDEATMTGRCSWPGRLMMRTKVWLESVDYAAPPPDAGG
jgi:hypothetical protein